MGVHANREQIVADFDNAGHGQGKPFNRSAYRIRFDAAFQCHDAFVCMHIDALGIDRFALNEPLGNLRFQLIAIDAIRWQRSGGMSRVFFEPGRVSCICDKAGIGFFVKIRRGGAISPIFRVGRAKPAFVRIRPAITTIAILIIAIILFP